MLNTIAAKEDNYKEGIKVNHTMAKNAAKRIRELEQMMIPEMMEGIMTNEELTAFFREQKDAVKKVAEENVAREHYVNSFVSAVRTVQQQVTSNSRRSNSNDEENQNGDDDGMVDYQKAIDKAMLQQLQGSDGMTIEVYHESSYRDVAEALGEPVTVKKKRKKKTANSKDDDDDDEDDIQVVQTETQGGLTLKCPITGAYMDDAVRNKVCSHVYSLAGITAHINNARTKNDRRVNHCQCPMAGCVNQSVSQAQLEPDVETVINVRREKRQHDKKAQQHASQASELIDTDDDEQ